MDESHRTPPKFVENFSADIRGEMGRRNVAYSSPFAFLPNMSTPPDRFVKIKNPFEAALNERLHSHVFSPSVFAEAKRSRGSDRFRWTIDEMSSLQPAQIDESAVHQVEPSNPEEEVRVQAKIEKYFSESHIVPSPWNEEPKIVPLISPLRLNQHPGGGDEEEPKETCDGWSQTVLSLPPVLPPEVEAVLAPYLTFTKEKQLQNTIDQNASLVRRLFDHDNELHDASASSSSSSMMHSSLSSVMASPNLEAKRTFGATPPRSLTPVEVSPILAGSPERLKDCRLSPISTVEARRNRSVPGADSSGHMSVDVSFEFVPRLAHPEESPVRTNEFTENCDWDVEFNSVTLNGGRPTRRSLFENSYGDAVGEMDVNAEGWRAAYESMDISRLTTPKSKMVIAGQRKLSESFRTGEAYDCDDDDDDHHHHQHRHHHDLPRTKTAAADDNSRDTGYSSSAIGYSSSAIGYSDGSCDAIFASTPTKGRSIVNIIR